MKVEILHNVTKDDDGRLVGFFGLKPGHQLKTVFTYEATVRDGYEHAYEFTNEPIPSSDLNSVLVREYRSRKLRSLSVGDVVIVDGVPQTVKSFGYGPIDLTDYEVI